MLETIDQTTGPDPRWAIIWLHGLGADGNDFAPIVPELVRPGWPAIRFVFPHAPVRPITVNGGYRMRAWYDIADMSALTNRADEAGVRESVGQIDLLIEREAERGIPAARIVLAGFSQGGAVALDAAVRREIPLAGVIALSTYLPLGEATFTDSPAITREQPVFMAHGTLDPVVPIAAGRRSAELLLAEGFDVTWREYPMPHTVSGAEIADLGDWLQGVVHDE